MYEQARWLYSAWSKDTRFYGLKLTQNIFGNWIVERNWGSQLHRGSGQSKYWECGSYEQALQLYRSQEHRRQRRGYSKLPY
jgi:predicted DNA-binding WGR domain protein